MLTQEQRADLREFFDYDKNDIFLTFMRVVQEKVRKKSVIGLTEWDTIVNTVTRESQVGCIDELLKLLDDEMSNQEVEFGGEDA